MRLGLNLALSRTGGVPFYADATVALDFANSRYRNGLGAPVYADPSLVSGFSYSRTGTEYAQTSSGLLVPFGSGVPADTDLGLQVWEARTNLALQSQTLDSATWNKASATVTADTTVAPDGTTTADTVLYSASSSGTINQSQTLTVATYTVSAYIKSLSGGTQQVRFNYFNGTGNVTGSDLTVTTAWQRFTFSFTGAAAAGNIALITASAAAAANVSVWGFQVELGSFAGPYIPTTSASATRGAASASVGGLSIAGDFTALAVLSSPGSSVNTLPAVELNDGSGNNRMFVAQNGSGGSFVNAVVGGVSDTGAALVIGTSGRIKMAVRRSGSTITGAAAGVVSSTAATASFTATSLYAGNRADGARAIDTQIERVVLFPRALSNAELVSLTT